MQRRKFLQSSILATAGIAVAGNPVIAAGDR
jgi:hypothetical protein